MTWRSLLGGAALAASAALLCLACGNGDEPAGATDATSAEPSCGQVLDCRSDCPEVSTHVLDPDCEQACAANASATSRAVLDPVDACLQQHCPNGLGDIDCSVEFCFDLLHTCYGGDGDCNALFDCVHWDCGEVPSCQRRCFYASATQLVIDHMFNVHDCFTSICRGNPPDKPCVKVQIEPGGQCADQYAFCRSAKPGDPIP